MDLLYSLSLLLALIGGGIGGALAAWSWAKGARGASLRRWATAMLGCAGLSLLVSVGVHAYWGHGPASAEPMGAATFMAIHPSFVVAGGILLLGLGMMLAARKRQVRGPSEA